MLPTAFHTVPKSSFGHGPLQHAVRRHLNLHEYQSKDLMDRYGVPTQIGYTCETPSAVREGADKLIKQGFKTVVLKSQVFAGGRGKGTLSSGLKGGIQFAQDAGKAAAVSERMFGYKLVTHQTDKNGLDVKKLLVTEGVDIDKEFYLAIVLDRAKGGPVIVASREGGVEIEEVAEKHPEAVHVEPIDILTGISQENLERICKILLPTARESVPARYRTASAAEQERVYCQLRSELKTLVTRLYDLFEKCDSSQVEINPLAVTSDSRVLCVDAKLNFDDNAFFRQKELFAQEDQTTRDPRELEAEASHLNFVTMSGNIGCLVNGAGLAMATMDLIAYNGGSPANFLDLGGGATKDQVLASFRLLIKDPNVNAIFVNIFGGITRCDVVAQGLLEAAQELRMKVPIVVRLVGNNADKAKEILNTSALEKTGINIRFVQDFASAAKAACEIARA